MCAMTKETERLISIKVPEREGEGGGPALVLNVKEDVTAFEAGRLAHLCPVLFFGMNREIPWHKVIAELGVERHFDRAEK